MATLLNESEIADRLDAASGWSLDGTEIKKVYSFRQYLDGIEFVSRVGHLAEKENHHPDISVGWRKVTVSFSTHSAGGLTALDFKLAALVDAAVEP